MTVHPTRSHHSEHDLLLIAAAASNDLEGRALDQALRQAEVCSECAELLTDLRAIASATAALPAPRRTRDFRLTQADAARLRPRGWRRIVRLFGEPRFGFTRPLALGLTTLGVGGLLLASLPSFAGLGGAASAPVLQRVGNAIGSAGAGSAEVAAPAASAAPAAAAASAAPAPVEGQQTAPSAAPSAASRSADQAYSTNSGPGVAPAGSPAASQQVPGNALPPEASAQDKSAYGPAASAGGQPLEALAPRTVTTGTAPEGGPSPLVVLSVVFLFLGLSLSALRWVAGHLIA